MSHPNPAGNGCSLEDCYTNLFALTDICGIKWRKLATNPDSHVLGLDHLEDPVLVSYSKCIQSDILCVWRRVQKTLGEQHTDHLSFNKELWIFWYGDEPAALDSHVSKDLTEMEGGSWDKGKDHGLPYECRTLLFKALHNLIERCLLTKGFVRLGRWFVQPYDSQAQNTDRQTHLSFCFNFFLHGESSVCASIEVKQHPPVWRLTPQHLTLTQENHTNFQVILAPYGLNGTLTGQSYRETDQNAHKILEDWGKFYPIDMSDKDGDPAKTPALVEIIVAGVRMKYPSSFVLLCEIDEYLTKSNAAPPSQTTNMPHPQTVVPNSHLTPPSSPADVSILSDHGAKGGGGGTGSMIGTHHMDVSSDLIAKSERVFSCKIQEKALQDNCVNSGIAKRSSETISEDTVAGIWDFNDPTAKLNCNCSRHRLSKNKPILTGQNKPQTGSATKHGKGDVKAEKVERPPSRVGRNSTMPFHKQSAVNDTQIDIDLMIQRVPVQGMNFNNSNSASNSLPQLKNAGEGNTGMEVQSPTAVPSPLEEPHSHSHASQSGEPTMPKLSPHPPPEVPEKEGLQKTPTENASPMVNGHVDFAKPNEISMPKTAENVFSPPWVQSESKNASIDNWIKSQQQQHKHTDIPGIKRPSLPTLQADGDNFVTENLYNLDHLNLWLNFPVIKKPRYEALSPDGDDPLSLSQSHRNSPQNSLEDDPYEFSDEASRNPATITNRKLRDSQNDGFHNRKSPYGRMDDETGRLDSGRDDKPNEQGSLTSPPATPNTALKESLMQVNDLVPKTSDLDHIFESDSDNDDAFMTQDKNISEDLKHTKVVMNMPPTEGVIAASELIRMYPTPPSNNPEISPGTYGHEVIDTVERIIIKKEINAPSLEEFFKDVPSVFQPPEQEEFVSSEKYSTVTLPSNKLSPIHHPPEYKPSWQFPMPIMEKPPPNSYINIPSIENIPSLPSRMPSSAIESSPAMFQTSSVGPQRTPMSYELQSPASNASSYLNKTLNSVDNQGTNNQIAEVHSLIVNILLMDSRLNVFKDANFDSCNFCVCNGNIKGADSGILIEDPTGEAQYSCTCGFSAIRNRRFGINAGIFYEDEVDITGVRNDRFDRRKPGLLSLELNSEHKGDDPNMLVLELLLGQFTVPYSSPSSSQLLIRLTMNTNTSYAANSVDDFPLKDGNEVSYTALDQGRQAMEHCLPTKLDDPQMKSTCLHKWQFIQGATNIPLNSQDSQHLLNSLQPLLQDAIQNKRVTRLWEQTFKLTGPLTWKEFHQMAGRGNEENSSPQPIPALLVGNDSDWLSVSPYSLRFWEKQFMEPYGKQRDIAYVVLAPDNNYVIDYVKIFFKELSNIYELCRFGRHAPFAKKLRDGIMRIGKKQAATKCGEEPGEEWFKQLGESPVVNKLKLYAQVCSSWLAPLLGQQTLDQSVFEPNTNFRAGYKPTEASQINSSTEHVFTVPQTSSNEDKDDDMKTRLVCSAPIPDCLSLPSSRSSSTSSQSLQGGGKADDEEKEEKNEGKSTENQICDPTPSWRESIRRQMEEELEQRVREALETPPLERAKRAEVNSKERKSCQTLNELNSHIVFGLTGTNRDVLKSRKWRALQAKRQVQRLMRMNYIQPTPPVDYVFQEGLSRSNQADFPGVFGLTSLSEGVKDLRQSFEKYPSLTQIQRQFYTKHGFLATINSGHGNNLKRENGKYKDRYGVERDQDGPFWPSDCGPLFPTPRFQWFDNIPPEPLFFHVHNQQYPKTFDNQVTQYSSKWRGVLIVYDSERSSRDRQAQPVPEGCCPNLVFESRFESGNLRQARRVGQYEYELVLKTDLYTNRHTQWYYFRVSNTVPGVVYKFRIVNLLKRDSLYNYGMRPLQYSEKSAKLQGRGWMRAGHHVSYSRNVMHLHCPLLTRGIAYYMLEWQMDFPHEEDVSYLAHCYPYTFTDLKEDLDSLINAPERKECMKREVLCETRAGNSCFLVTVSNFGVTKEEQNKKKFVVVTARVHPGETQASWMMKGLLEFITSCDPVAKELRNRFIFKIVPMLNPDGVIVGNYRCSLAARDLNRNYRHPRKESFPTVWHTKTLIEKIQERHEILLYCDLHGHSRKHNVFMYGNNTSEEDVNGIGAAKAFLNERLFAWLMSQKAPDKFAFKSCKFNIKRCKESTGRVVMWRQMKILNSFTLEATFSGTILNKNELRHFNVHDFQEMGKVLSQTMLEYQRTQENNAKQSEMVLELTRYVTQQVMEQRGLVDRTKIPNLRALMKGDNQTNNVVANNTIDSGIDSSHEKRTPEPDVSSPVFKEAILTCMEHDNIPIVLEEKKVKKTKKLDKMQSNLSRKEVDNLLDNASLKTMDGCLKILAQLNVREVMQESDSSDSDSESEPEMKPVETKSKKKKRKSRKQRDKEQQDRKNGSGGSDKKSEDVRSKSLTALPNITACSDLNDRDKGDKTLPKQVYQGALVLRRAKIPITGRRIPLAKVKPIRKQRPSSLPLPVAKLCPINVKQSEPTTTSFEKFMRAQKKEPHFVSKYEGRRNGGIPCFAEERSIERAQKRMADMKKRTEEDKQREMAFFSYDQMMEFINRQRNPPPPLFEKRTPEPKLQCTEDDGIYNCSQQIMSIRRSLTQDDLKHRLQVALHEGSSNIAQTLVGLNVRTTYTHADAFRDMNSSIPTLPQPRDISTDDGSESEADFSTTLSLAARNNPYVHQDAVHLQMLPLDVTQKKSYRSSGPLTRSSRRQSTPSITFSNTPPNIFPMADEIKTEKRPRITPTTGPLTIFGEESVPKIRGFKVKTES